MRMTLLSLACLALFACKAEAPPAADAPSDAASTETPAPSMNEPAPAAPSTTDDTPSASDPKSVLAGTTWRVERRSDGGEIGSTYAFMDDGTLVVDGPNSTPMTGSWQVDDKGALSMTEEGITYSTDLVRRDEDHITLRSHNPGGVLEIALVRVP